MEGSFRYILYNRSIEVILLIQILFLVSSNFPRYFQVLLNLLLSPNGRFMTTNIDFQFKLHNFSTTFLKILSQEGNQKKRKTKFEEMLGASKRLVNSLYIRLKRFCLDPVFAVLQILRNTLLKLWRSVQIGVARFPVCSLLGYAYAVQCSEAF